MKLNCEFCDYFKKVPLSKDKGLCMFNPPIAIMMQDKNGVLSPVSFRPVVEMKDFCSNYSQGVSELV